MAFEKGNKLGKGKPRGSKSVGSGRTTEWLKAKCQRLIDRGKIIEFLLDVAMGKDVEQKVNENGEVIKIPADVRDRIKASEILIDRGFGKCAQPIGAEGDVLSELLKEIRNKCQ